MKLRLLKILPILLLSLIFAGCSSMPGSDSEKGDAAPVSGPSKDAGGAQTQGANQGGAWTGNPLENPDSLLYAKVIYFDFDVDQVRADFRDVVIAHGDYLAANPAITVTLEGHADERGSREYNIGLGERRANKVQRMLLGQGVSDSQITIISYGEERPAAGGSNEASCEQNRRAVFVY